MKMITNENSNLFPKDFYAVSDFDKILKILSDKCYSQMGKDLVSNIQFSSDVDTINKSYSTVVETFNILKNGQNLPIIETDDFSADIAQLRIPAWVISVESLFQLLKLLICFQDVKLFFKNQLSASEINKIINNVVFHTDLIKKIQKIIDDKGEIKDTASAELQQLRLTYKSKQKLIDKQLNQIFKQLKTSGLLEESLSLTIRNGRSVIPVPASAKYSIKGIIHDESASGQTAYVEPIEIVVINNQLRENEAAQQREIRKILTEISSEIHLVIDDILQYFPVLGLIDFVSSKARFAMQYNCCIPQVEDKQILDWKNAKNLVLQIHLSKQNSQLIPLNLRMDENCRMIVISGANAGGKSVVLKTVALIQTMVQCGIPATLSENSTVGVFSSIHLDIGDGQSLEANLSTYTSHLVKIKSILSNSNPKSLYLLDEVGTGTDPVLGGALAQAILLKLHSMGAWGIITTHLDSIKQMADELIGAQNAAMMFDTNKLEPSYLLKTGIPGNSFTFEIARRTGIPEDIIQQAVIYAGDERIKFEKKISDVEAKSNELDDKIQKNKIAEDFLSDLITKYSGLVNDFEIKQKDIIEKTKAEAKSLLQNTNKTIENSIREIKESEANKEVSKEARLKIKNLEQQIEQFTPENKLPEKHSRTIKKLNIKKTLPTVENKNFKTGQRVKHQSSNTIGEISKILKNGNLIVAFDSVMMTLKPDQLNIVTENRSTSNKSVKLKESIVSRANNFKPDLDLRGFRAEEIQNLLEKHIDEALLVGVKSFSILHGRGHGILRSVVKQVLAKHSNVASYEHEHIERGGDGITIVHLS